MHVTRGMPDGLFGPTLHMLLAICRISYRITLEESIALLQHVSLPDYSAPQHIPTDPLHSTFAYTTAPRI
jgi:hypothetical protein